MQTQPTTRIGHFIDSIEETSIAVCLGLMTAITFANVVARYALDSNILWALELTTFLFAWLVLMGMSYAVKKHVHIGVDVIINAAAHTAVDDCGVVLQPVFVAGQQHGGSVAGIVGGTLSSPRVRFSIAPSRLAVATDDPCGNGGRASPLPPGGGCSG